MPSSICIDIPCILADSHGVIGGCDLSEYVFLELDEDVHRGMIEDEGFFDDFQIKGRDDDNLVICTSSKTYSVRRVICNSKLLCISKPDYVVRNILSFYYEMERTPPRLCKLFSYFNESSYGFGREAALLCSKEELFEMVQGSKGELEHALRHVDHVNIGGKIRVFNICLVKDVWEVALAVISMRDTHCEMSVCDLTREVKDTGLIDENEEVIQKIIYLYLAERIEGVLDDECGLVGGSGEKLRIHRRKLFLVFGEAILKKYRKMEFEQFVCILQKAIPICKDVDFKLLGDLYVVVDDTSSERENMKTEDRNVSDVGRFVYYYPKYMMSSDSQTRFTNLFTIRKKWTLDELTPFVQSLLVGERQNKMNIMNLIERHCKILAEYGKTTLKLKP